MMEIRTVIQCFCVCLMAIGCSSANNSCSMAELDFGDSSIYVQPYSTSDILESELKRGSISKNQQKSRRDLLDQQLHFKIRVLNNKGFNEKQESFFQKEFENSIALNSGEQSLQQSLFINESSFAHKNMMQYFVAFERTVHNKTTPLTITIDGAILGLKKEVASFHQRCFE